MLKIRIDNQELEVESGTTILQAARQVGIRIPTLCYREGQEPSASCMVCVVKVEGRDGFVPACATRVQDGVHVLSETAEVRDARRMALELLLGDHLGDCVGPCEIACPAHLDIPKMIRQIAAGDLQAAAITIKEKIPLPATLGRICSAPCEKACRRGQLDEAVSICLLKRFVADADLASEQPYLSECKASSGKKVAIIGAGPAGLAAAYYLQQQGHACVIFDDHDQPGGLLRYGVEPAQLPREVLDAEIALIEKLGAEFRMKTKVADLDELKKDYDALLITIGEVDAETAGKLGLTYGTRGIEADRKTFVAGPGVFVAGNAIAPVRLAAKAIGEGRQAAFSICEHLSGSTITEKKRPFSVHMGKLSEEELQTLAAGASLAGRAQPEDSLAEKDARAEAARCLHCDCRKKSDCTLRTCAEEYDAKVTRFKFAERRPLDLQLQHDFVVYESGKCIKCGTCIMITQQAAEPLGLSFVGRGFDVRVAVPFGSELRQGLQKTAQECVRACPTGALACKDTTAE